MPAEHRGRRPAGVCRSCGGAAGLHPPKIGLFEGTWGSVEEQRDAPAGSAFRRLWIGELTPRTSAAGFHGDPQNFDASLCFAEAVEEFGLNAFAVPHAWWQVRLRLIAARHSLRSLRLNWADLYMSDVGSTGGFAAWVGGFRALEELDLVGGQHHCRCSVLGVLLRSWRSNRVRLPKLRLLRLTLHDEPAEEAWQLRSLAELAPDHLPALSFVDLSVRPEVAEDDITRLRLAAALPAGVQVTVNKHGPLSICTLDDVAALKLTDCPYALLRNGLRPRGGSGAGQMHEVDFRRPSPATLGG